MNFGSWSAAHGRRGLLKRLRWACGYEPQFFDRLNYAETFEKCSILVKIKPPAHRGLRPGGEGDNFNHRNILNISRIKI
jgi:hypothetical protein